MSTSSYHPTTWIGSYTLHLDSRTTRRTSKGEKRRLHKKPQWRRNLNPPLETARALLTLRKDYKNTSVALVKARTHCSFVSTCKGNSQTPKGLRIGVNCSAFLADLTDARPHQFETTSKTAETQYVDHLHCHYRAQLKQKQSILLDTMTTVLERATLEEKDEHTRMRRKTDDNSRRLARDLAEKKKPDRPAYAEEEKAKPIRYGEG